MNQKYNKGPWRVCTFLASALIALVFMRALPVIAVGDYEVKPVDFLSDLLPEDSSAAPLQTPSAVAESTKALVEAIKNSQIIMLPGGFSGGDEPDGSAKRTIPQERRMACTGFIRPFRKEKVWAALCASPISAIPLSRATS